MLAIYRRNDTLFGCAGCCTYKQSDAELPTSNATAGMDRLIIHMILRFNTQKNDLDRCSFGQVSAPMHVEATNGCLRFESTGVVAKA